MHRSSKFPGRSILSMYSAGRSIVPRSCGRRSLSEGVWLQSGIINLEARELAAKAKIDFVQNRCIMVEHMHRDRASPRCNR